jgi:flagellar motor switch protein FliN/FliY
MAKQPVATAGRDRHYFHQATAGPGPPHFSPLPDTSSGNVDPQHAVSLPIDGSDAAVASDPAALNKFRDIELDLTIELGRAEMPLEKVIGLQPGMVVPLDKLAGEPVDVVVDGRLVARGEMVVVDDHFCVRVAELVAVARAA